VPWVSTQADLPPALRSLTRCNLSCPAIIGPSHAPEGELHPIPEKPDHHDQRLSSTFKNILMPENWPIQAPPSAIRIAHHAEIARPP